MIGAVSQLGIPSDLLIKELGEALGLKDEKAEIGEIKENPISILTSVFVLIVPLLEIQYAKYFSN